MLYSSLSPVVGVAHLFLSFFYISYLLYVFLQSVRERQTNKQDIHMSFQEDVSQFDLPFQWDDGKFVSPFVRSSQESLNALAVFLAPRIREAERQADSLHETVESTSTECKRRSTKHHRREVVVRVTDLGCGDGMVVLELVRTLPALLLGAAAPAGAPIPSSSLVVGADEQSPPTHSFVVEGVGLDLDEDLVQLALQNASKMDLASSCHFTVQDLHDVTVASILLPRQQQQQNVVAVPCSMHGDGDDQTIRMVHVVFIFLLPSAMDMMKELILALLPHISFFVSNSWEVPYLTPNLVEKVGSYYVYAAKQR